MGASCSCSKKETENLQEELDISNQDLKEIDKAVWSMSRLLKLKISKNQISILPPELKNLKLLQVLEATDTGMTCFPRELSSTIQMLKLNDNRLFYAPITPNIGLLVNLHHLNLSGNQLETLPAEISTLSSLRTMILSKNLFAEIPEGIFGLSQTLEFLSLSSNKMTKVDERIDTLGALKTLDLNDNKISIVPHSIGGSSSLATLQLATNIITELPDSLGELTNLVNLEVYDNPHLVGLPISLQKLSKLEKLSIYGTKSDHFPFALEAWRDLLDLNIKNNPAIDEIPETIGGLIELRSLDCQDCSLTSLPLNIGGLRNLRKLDLKKNRITSAGIPESISQLDCLIYLSLSKNYLTTLRDEMFQLRTLQELDLSSNSIHVIPDEISALTSLTKLYIGNNKLDQLPATLSSLTKLSVLEFKHNMVAGLPVGIEKCPLTKIDGSDNHLIDLPDLLRNIPCLVSIDFKGNNLPSDLHDAVNQGIPKLQIFLGKREELRGYEKNKRDKINKLNAKN